MKVQPIWTSHRLLCLDGKALHQVVLETGDVTSETVARSSISSHRARVDGLPAKITATFN